MSRALQPGREVGGGAGAVCSSLPRPGLEGQVSRGEGEPGQPPKLVVWRGARSGLGEVWCECTCGGQGVRWGMYGVHVCVWYEIGYRVGGAVATSWAQGSSSSPIFAWRGWGATQAPSVTQFLISSPQR